MRSIVIYTVDGAETPAVVDDRSLRKIERAMDGAAGDRVMSIPDGDGGKVVIAIGKITRLRVAAAAPAPPIEADRDAPPSPREMERFGVV